MQYAPLGSTGFNVSRLCLGTATFGGQSDDATSFSILDACAAQGVNFIDTANVYPLGSEPQEKGNSERIAGQWLRGKRHQFILATKGGGVMSPRPGDSGNSEKHLLAAVDASLKRLGTDYIDLYQLHYDDPNTPLDETLKTLDTIVRTGRARHVGISNFQPWRLARAIGRCETNRWVTPASVQPRYNLLFRQIERDLIPLCREEKLGMICYNPLAGGLLSGKHSLTKKPDASTRFGSGKSAGLYMDRYWHEREFLAVSKFLDIALQAGMEPVRLAIAWVLSEPAVSSVIIGASRAEQLPEVLSATKAELNADLLARLNDLSLEFRMGDASR
ncbi:MAG: aldo/keto reductase [Rhodoferax sp.]|jgi:aryl-alcohol dehydrogenase (NADP+)|nr:aldo/keto reductase [Rhodoferax sp.]